MSAWFAVANSPACDLSSVEALRLDTCSERRALRPFCSSNPFLSFVAEAFEPGAQKQPVPPAYQAHWANEVIETEERRRQAQELLVCQLRRKDDGRDVAQLVHGAPQQPHMTKGEGTLCVSRRNTHVGEESYSRRQGLCRMACRQRRFQKKRAHRQGLPDGQVDFELFRFLDHHLPINPPAGGDLMNVRQPFQAPPFLAGGVYAG